MACVMTPMVLDFPNARPRAAAFGRKLSFAIAASTACLRSGLTFAVPLMMRDTVAMETPASFATISNVGGASVIVTAARALPLLALPLLTLLVFEARFFIASSCFQRRHQVTLQLFERASLGLRHQRHYEHQRRGGEQSEYQKRSAGAQRR